MRSIVHKFWLLPMAAFIAALTSTVFALSRSAETSAAQRPSSALDRAAFAPAAERPTLSVAAAAASKPHLPSAGPAAKNAVEIELPPLSGLDAFTADRLRAGDFSGTHLRNQLYQLLATVRPKLRDCISDNHPGDTKLRIPLQVRSEHATAEVVSVGAVDVHRGAPLPATSTACLATTLSTLAGKAIPAGHQAFPSYEGDAQVFVQFSCGRNSPR